MKNFSAAYLTDDFGNRIARPNLAAFYAFTLAYYRGYSFH